MDQMYAQTVKIALEKFRVCFRINYNRSQYVRESSKITNQRWQSSFNSSNMITIECGE